MTQNLWQGARRAGATNPTCAVLLLHGLGSNADDLIELAPYLAPALPEAVFLSPNAPFACDMAPYGHQWFSLLDRSPANILAGIRTAAPLLERMIADVQQEYHLPAARLALLGFSQGAMMSLHVAPRLPAPVAAVVALSGALVAPELLDTELQSRPPVLLAHGQQDPIVPFDALPAAEAALLQHGFHVGTEIRPNMQHNIDEVVLQRSADFLRHQLGGAGAGA